MGLKLFLCAYPNNVFHKKTSSITNRVHLVESGISPCFYVTLVFNNHMLSVSKKCNQSIYLRTPRVGYCLQSLKTSSSRYISIMLHYQINKFTQSPLCFWRYHLPKNIKIWHNCPYYLHFIFISYKLNHYYVYH